MLIKARQHMHSCFILINNLPNQALAQHAIFRRCAPQAMHPTLGAGLVRSLFNTYAIPMQSIVHICTGKDMSPFCCLSRII